MLLQHSLLHAHTLQVVYYGSLSIRLRQSKRGVSDVCFERHEVVRAS
jgi:hypothetical protein